MKERVANLLAKADDSLESAKLLLAEDHPAGAINRAYYAMFDACRCLLFIEGLFVKTHKGLQAKLHELYFKDAKLPRQLGTVLAQTEDLREKADYDFSQTVSSEDAQKAVNDAAYVLKEIKLYLSGINLFDQQEPSINA